LYTSDPVKPFKLSHDEIIATVHVPPQPKVGGAAFMKLTQRGGLEFAILSVAASLEMEPNGATCKTARITLGAVAPRPLRAKEAEAAMTGQSLSPDLFREVARIVSEEARPYPHHGSSSGYLKYALETQAFRTLAKAAEGISRG
jgi:CO/xanthine dehydrogenase FAD-binding subunit